MILNLIYSHQVLLPTWVIARFKANSVFHPSGVDKWVAGLISICVPGGAIWWMLARYRPTWSDVSSTLAPSVSGSLLGYTYYLVVAVLRDSIGISSLSCVTARCRYVLCMVCVCQTSIKKLLLLLLLDHFPNDVFDNFIYLIKPTKTY